MAGRRPGPPPKDPSQRQRTNADPVIGNDGWTEIPDAPNDGTVPSIPEWVGEVSEAARVVYTELASLPQARLWGPGTWLELHLSLPMFDKYMEKPGGEGLRTLIGIWGVSLRLTEDDLQKARVKVRKQAGDDELEEAARNNPKVASMADRRQRLLKQQEASGSAS